MPAQPIAGIILAAGKGTRMKSDLPKGLHAVCGLPMVELIGRAMKSAGIERPIVVVGHGGELLQQALGDSYDYAWQREQHGTGHAAQMAADLIRGHNGPVVIAPGDTPLLSAEVISTLLEAHGERANKCTMASAIVADPKGYGRVLRDDEGRVRKIVEEKDATPEERAVNEVNAGIYCFDCATLLDILPRLSNANAQGEYYLTDAVEAVADTGQADATVFEDHEILMGVNDRWQLAQADKALRLRILRQHALNGVTLMDPDTIYIGADVSIGPDCLIEPSTMLIGATSIGAGCQIGPFTRIKDSEIGDGCYVYLSHVTHATLREGVKVGPFANLRPDAVLEDSVRIGNFVEVKNSTLAAGSKANHLAYIGDASVGVDTNIGAGTITCNYDGFQKHRTQIGNNVFVGSNSTLVAPVTLADGSMIAAGSVVTRDVPEDALGIGRSRTEVKEEWAAHWRRRHQSKTCD
jgi:bifunctional UDP-N-acetylglucosamine pyrophosphorylase / glucosamine-1-phosphate N-acetyltransferase